jgi:hypothetical protein
MSPELKDYYRTKTRRMAFYIVEHEINNEENPPEISAIIGLDKELEDAFYAARRPPMEKPAMQAGIRVNRDTHSVKIKKDKNDKETVKKKQTKRDGMHCPSLPTQWRNHLDIIIPKAEFGHPTTKRKI